MERIQESKLAHLNTKQSLWDQVFTVAPLVIIGTREDDKYDLAPKHMVTPIGFGPYFGFVCTPRHATFHNIKDTGEFTVSFPKPDQLVFTSLSATPRKDSCSNYDIVFESLPMVKALNRDLPIIEGAYLYLECRCLKILDGFDDYAIITGEVLAAYADSQYTLVSERDKDKQLRQHPLLVYVAPGRFATITQTFNFPFPKDFER
ncbi:flavin reductase [Lentiprolixibacter aurantiacus]|uniref:Flavin reductase n=1 Tax=Lentiprolixibacter aurantiacus TaxID=2993939 RepID=A0AAE3SPF5_9FLAO|nr:flavin reductase [Lentiprolixibacter aurantiacus]MCX2720762.1 flavin reductase [Lentiprolixibacter aurantiacus]